MEKEHPFPRRLHRIALKPPLLPETISGHLRRHHSTETSTISTSGVTSSSHIPESAQFFSRNLGSSTVVEMESS